MIEEPNHDRIVYLVTDSEGAEVEAHFNKTKAHAQARAVDGKVQSMVIDVHKMRATLLGAMDPVARLVMNPPNDPVKRRSTEGF